MHIALTAGEIDWLIAMCPEEEYGREFRARLFAERLKMPQHTAPVNWVTVMDIDLDTLWIIDSGLFCNEPFSNHLFDQTPLKVLSDKIWRAIATAMGYLEEEDARDYSYEEAYKAASEKANGAE